LPADPGHLALADPDAAHCDDQVINPPGRDPFDIRLHPHRARVHVDTPPRGPQGRNNDPVRTFGIFTVRSPAAVVTSLSRVPLRWVVLPSVRLCRPGADMRGRLRVHHGVKHAAEQPAHQLAAVGGAEQLEQGRIV
jgi:hypothetical protein